MKAKQFPRKLFIGLLTLGSSLTLGLLSFGGMYAVWPILPLALASFVLSTAYEGEVFMQNISSGLKKLLKPGYLKQEMAKKYLIELSNMPTDENTPAMLSDYAQLSDTLKRLKALPLTKTNKKAIKRCLKQQKLLEKWFAKRFFPPMSNTDKDYNDFMSWIEAMKLMKRSEAYQATYQRRRKIFIAARVIALVSGVFMGLGTAYLLASTVSVIPFLSVMAATPAIGIPIFSILIAAASIAYALQTYNCITDMVQQEVMQKWFREIKGLFSKDFNWRHLVKVAGIVFLIGSAIALTVCTAGTWWTIAKAGTPLFSWMKSFSTPLMKSLMKFVNPIIMALSAGAFNISNTYESYEEITEAIEEFGDKNKKSIFRRMADTWHELTAKENAGQIINPFRLILNLTFFPIRVALFLGHLFSIGSTADRLPGIPELITALFVSATEGFEDFHYIFGTSQDIPTRLLKLALSPLFLFAATWDFVASRFNQQSSEKEQLTFSRACKKNGLFVYDYINKYQEDSDLSVEEQQEQQELLSRPLQNSTQRMICQQMVEKATVNKLFSFGKKELSFSEAHSLNKALNSLSDETQISDWLKNERNRDEALDAPVYGKTALKLFDKIEKRIPNVAPPVAEDALVL